MPKETFTEYVSFEIARKKTLNQNFFLQSSNALHVALSSFFCCKKNFSPAGNNKAIQILDWLLLKVNYGQRGSH